MYIYIYEKLETYMHYLLLNIYKKQKKKRENKKRTYIRWFENKLSSIKKLLLEIQESAIHLIVSTKCHRTASTFVERDVYALAADGTVCT